MYDRILVPTDGSDHALAAAKHALELATTYDAELYALYVVDTGTSWLRLSRTDIQETLRGLAEDAGGQALSPIEALAENTPVTVVKELREGTPHEVIVAAVTDEDVDLVVMGTHGRDGIRHRLLGSVAERVVRGSDVPVMTVTAEETED